MTSSGRSRTPHYIMVLQRLVQPCGLSVAASYWHVWLWDAFEDVTTHGRRVPVSIRKLDDWLAWWRQELVLCWSLSCLILGHDVVVPDLNVLWHLVHYHITRSPIICPQVLHLHLWWLVRALSLLLSLVLALIIRISKSTNRSTIFVAINMEFRSCQRRLRRPSFLQQEADIVSSVSALLRLLHQIRHGKSLAPNRTISLCR